ncbi:MAG TPA: Hpt domain-containing protein, partial [Holophaga sp.]|nr:Hpt domain-containing protein [Holophaga sp.]
MSNFAMDDPSFYEDFLVEAQEHFELIEQNFLSLEENPGDLDILNAIFRSVHTIKGASGFLGLAKVQALAHIGENILDDLRKGRMALREDVMELLFETVDALKVLVNDVGLTLRKQGQPADPDTSDLIARLEALRGGGAVPSHPAAEEAPSADLALPAELALLDEVGRGVLVDLLGKGGAAMALRIELLPGLLGTAFNPLSMLSMADLVGTLLHSGHLLKGEPDLDAFEADQFPFDLLLLIQPSESPEGVQKLFNGVKHVRIHYHLLEPGRCTPLGASAAPPPTASPSAPPPPADPAAAGPG